MSDPRESASPAGETPQESSRREALEGLAALRESIRQGRSLPPPPADECPDWDLHERRLDEIEGVLRSSAGPEDMPRFTEMVQIFHLDYNADMGRLMAGVNARLVADFDEIAARVEEKKFEVPGDVRDGMEDMLLPYKDGIREEMLSALPIEKRRELDELKRRRDAGELPDSAG